MSPLTLYLLTRIDRIDNFFFTVSCLSFTVSLFMLFGYLIYSEDEKIKADKFIWISKCSIVTCAIFGFLLIWIPSKKDLAVIFGLSYVTQNQNITKIPDNAAKAVNKFLEDFLGEEEKK
jgi:hypothetical protein